MKLELCSGLKSVAHLGVQNVFLKNITKKGGHTCNSRDKTSQWGYKKQRPQDKIRE